MKNATKLIKDMLQAINTILNKRQINTITVFLEV